MIRASFSRYVRLRTYIDTYICKCEPDSRRIGFVRRTAMDLCSDLSWRFVRDLRGLFLRNDNFAGPTRLPIKKGCKRDERPFVGLMRKGLLDERTENREMKFGLSCLCHRDEVLPR